MGKGSTLPALLEAKNEPSIKSYNETVEDIIKNPERISSLTDNSIRDDILIVLTTHSHRLAQFFRLLRSTVRAKPKSPVSSTIAAETVNLLVDVLSHLHQLLGPMKVLEFLIPALDICFAASQCPTLWELASVLASSDTLLEHLVSSHPGIQIVRQWASMQNMIALDARTLELWTERLLSMVHNCTIDHDVAHEMQQWHTLKTLRMSLERIEGTTSPNFNRPAPTSRHELPALTSMTQLNREDKKARLASRQDSSNAVPFLQDGDKRSLKVFGIPVPGSKSSLLEAIKRLEGEKTTAILLSISSKLPCYTCVSGLESPSRTSKSRTRDEYIEALPMPQMEILDKGLGLWKVLLSPQALRSVLHMGSHGLDGSVTEKLNEIASGRWNPESQPYAASKFQKKRLRVPIAKTHCGQNQFILWQISVGIDEETGSPQQDIKVWEVCHYAAISKILDRVIFLQQSYSDETLSRCCEHSSAADGTQFPVRFEASGSHTAKLAKPPADLDIRTVDQNIIEMMNKFYALTEPMIQSIISKDLSAEFPFDLSKDEACVIRHFRTASLILGRSGTGKTTCLIFKLVGKYLASKALADGRPVRQVLLTRSSFLAEKLNSYTRRLIETLLPKSVERGSSKQSDYFLLKTAKEQSEKNTIFLLRDQSFPLVGTWDSFLEMLENTVTNLHRQGFDDVGESPEENLIDYTNKRRLVRAQFVDFHAFKRDYWPHFSRLLTKGLPVNLVFAEIMGVIKGSASSRDSLAPLRREEYLTRSCRLAPAFVLEAERSRVYEIFQAYERLKLGMGGADHVDRVVKLLRTVRGDSSLKQLLQSTFDEVYIDEVQDQRCLDVELLLSFIRDGRGFHFAGDTAQAISQDSTFRFSDIKALFYEHFAAASTATHQKEIARPVMFTLAKNYRSHEGILAVASLVMQMIWKGFPETVDKLEPEIGHLNGPKPVLFRGIDVSILRSRNIGHTTLAAGTADFGAEQVILVRDAEMKESLQGQIGNVALILTILESKGMEFDDVILWNFFTECPDEAGIRSLEILNKEPESFDSKRHGGMCSELKHLYVAITRARVQLFIMESSEVTVTTVLKFLATSSSSSLVQVTSPSHDDYEMRLEVLRPGTSLSPQQWSRRGAEFLHSGFFKEAFGCYQKSQDQCGQTTAEGHLREEEGKDCKAHENIEGFNQKLALARDCFLKVDLIDDAARVLVALGSFEDAAEILFQDKQYSRAAPFFASTGSSTKAIECYRLAGEYSEVAAILNKERNYDRLVSYLDENRGSIPSNTLQGYSLLCKLLLKQNKILPVYRRCAIRVLGSQVEQERCFLEYGMDDELARLYTCQLRYKDLFHLHTRNGQLDQALNLAITKNLLQPTADGLEPEVLNLLDYVWIGYIEKNRQHHSAEPLKLPQGHLTHKLKVRVEEWDASNHVYSREACTARQKVAIMKSTMPKTLLCLRNIVETTSITRVTKLDDLPFEMMHEAVKFAKQLAVNKDSDALKILLLLTGLWKPKFGQDASMILPWSPIREALTEVTNVEYEKVAMQLFLGRLVSAILEFDVKARDLWKKKWPRRCVPYMALGFCSRSRNREVCKHSHQLVTADDCSRMLDDLLQISDLFCNLALLYHRHSLGGLFRESYMKIKRYWLERLLRQFTYLSAIEQHSPAIVKAQTELRGDSKFIAVSSFLEGLLYYRLGKEWMQRGDFTSLLEQMQLAKVFGTNVHTRLFRALSCKLYIHKRHLMIRHLRLLDSLKGNFDWWNASCFQDRLMTFLGNLENIEVAALSTLHALTAEFESLAAFLILKLCVAACVIPNAWVDLHIATISKATRSSEPLQADDRHRYQQCLVHLGKSFCQVLSRLNTFAPPPPIDFLLCNGRTHMSLLLRQRNAELVAFVVVNLVATLPEPPFGSNEVWAKANEVRFSETDMRELQSLILVGQVFEYDFVKAFQLKSRNPGALIHNLAPSLAKYNGKDALLVVIKDRKNGHAFSNLEHRPDVKAIPFNQLCPQAPAVTEISNHQCALPNSTDGGHEQYSVAETDAVTRIQRLWRSCSSKIERRRSYVSTPEDRATARLFTLSTHCPSTTTLGDRRAIRKFLVLQGVSLSLRLLASQELLSSLQNDSMAFIENVEVSVGVFESVDIALGRNREAESLLNEAEGEMSDERLNEWVERGLHYVEDSMEKVEAVLVKAESCLKESRDILDAMSDNCT